MDASQAGTGEARIHAPRPGRRRRSDQPVQLPAQPRRPQARASARRRLRRGAQAGLSDSALGALPRGARRRGRPAAGVVERRRRLVRGDRRRPDRRRAGR
jgi:hypothetical protein